MALEHDEATDVYVSVVTGTPSAFSAQLDTPRIVTGFVIKIREERFSDPDTQIDASLWAADIAETNCACVVTVALQTGPVAGGFLMTLAPVTVAGLCANPAQTATAI